MVAIRESKKHPPLLLLNSALHLALKDMQLAEVGSVDQSQFLSQTLEFHRQASKGLELVAKSVTMLELDQVFHGPDYR